MYLLLLDIKANMIISSKVIIAPNAATIGANLGKHETKVIHIRPIPSVTIKV